MYLSPVFCSVLSGIISVWEEHDKPSDKPFHYK